MYAPIAGYTFRGASIPDYMADALKLWIDKGIEPGSFLMAVLENDLCEAISRADENNLHAIPSYVAYLYNEAPSPCWGSPEKCLAWLKHKQELASERQAREESALSEPTLSEQLVATCPECECEFCTPVLSRANDVLRAMQAQEQSAADQLPDAPARRVYAGDAESAADPPPSEDALLARIDSHFRKVHELGWSATWAQRQEYDNEGRYLLEQARDRIAADDRTIRLEAQMAKNQAIKLLDAGERIAAAEARAQELEKPWADTVSCNHVSESDYMVVRLHMCHGCIAIVKAALARPEPSGK